MEWQKAKYMSRLKSQKNNNIMKNGRREEASNCVKNMYRRKTMKRTNINSDKNKSYFGIS